MYDVYLAGSLRNPAIPEISRSLGQTFDVFSEWYAAGPEADDHWKSYHQSMGHSYSEALRKPSSINTFWFDRRNMENSRSMVLVLPAGKSGHLELGYFVGLGRPGFILLEEEDGRWDVMYQFATGVTHDLDDLSKMIRESIT